MRDFLKKIAGWAFGGLMALWAALDRLLDWVGKSTLPDDWRQLMDERLPAWLGWLFSTPWWVPAGLAIAAFAWMIWITIPRGEARTDAEFLKQQRLMLKERRLNRPDSDTSRQNGDETVISGAVHDAQPFESRGLYVGDMKMTGDDIQESHYLEISIRGFNGTGHRLAFPSIDGNIDYVAKEGSKTVASGQLLTPSLLRGRTNTWENENDAEFMIVLAQPVDPKTADNIATCLENGGAVHFELEKLHIGVAPSDNHSLSERLSIWNGISLRKPLTRYVSGRIISIKMNVQAFSMKASSPDAPS